MLRRQNQKGSGDEQLTKCQEGVGADKTGLFGSLNKARRLPPFFMYFI